MRRVLIALLAVFFLFDIYLAVSLFNPKLSSSIIQLIPKSRVSASSAIPNKKVSLRNENYLNKKLGELNFWGKENVIHYPENFKSGLERVTVERLRFVLTNKAQKYGQFSSLPDIKKVHFSYGQIYDSVTKEMTLLIHIDPAYLADQSLDSRYTGVALYAIFDIIHPTPAVGEGPVDPSYRKKGLSYIQDFTKSPEKLSIFNIY